MRVPEDGDGGSSLIQKALADTTASTFLILQCFQYIARDREGIIFPVNLVTPSRTIHPQTMFFLIGFDIDSVGGNTRIYSQAIHRFLIADNRQLAVRKTIFHANQHNLDLSLFLMQFLHFVDFSRGEVENPMIEGFCLILLSCHILGEVVTFSIVICFQTIDSPGTCFVK